MNAVVGSEQAKTKVRDSTVAQFYFAQLTMTKQTIWTLSPQAAAQAQDEARSNHCRKQCPREGHLRLRLIG